MSPAGRHKARSRILRKTTDACSTDGRSSTSPTPHGDIERPLSGVAGAAAGEAVADVAIGRHGAGEAIEVPLKQQLVLLALAAGRIVGLAAESAGWLHCAPRLDRRDTVSDRFAERAV